ncbi:MAG: lysoplasmalogenase [Woeseiaceae bacterium]|nr:lysoplasmalogenase [Woeseiaceae bacterium]
MLGHATAAAAAKLLASGAFVALALRVGAPHSNYGRLILLGLALSWVGDVLLIGQSRWFFLLGLGAFLLAHFAYLTAFIRRGVNTRWLATAALPVAATAIAIAAWLMPLTPTELRSPVLLYTAAISLMLATAIGTHGHRASAFIVAGALLFFVSDLSVAALRLAETDSPTYIWGLPLYYAAQVFLALSTSQSRSH